MQYVLDMILEVISKFSKIPKRFKKFCFSFVGLLLRQK